MAWTHVWRYTLRLFHTFAIFDKYHRNRSKNNPKIIFFLSKNVPWTEQGRLIVLFEPFYGVSKIFDFSMPLWNDKKCIKFDQEQSQECPAPIVPRRRGSQEGGKGGGKPPP